MSGVSVGPTPVALVIDDDEDTVALLQTVQGAMSRLEAAKSAD